MNLNRVQSPNKTKTSENDNFIIFSAILAAILEILNMVKLQIAKLFTLTSKTEYLDIKIRS